jgi:ferritin heavy chain
MATSQCRQNYHEECEAAINKQINMELYAQYVYTAMTYYFEREDVALKGFAKYFRGQSEEEREHAEKLMDFQNKRGGRIQLREIAKPAKCEWTSGLEAMQCSIELEKQVNEALLDMSTLAAKHKDAHLTDFLEEHFLDEQVETIKRLSDYITNLKRVGTGLGEYLFDKNTLSE